MIVTILPKEFLWTKNGVHDLDENKHAKIADKLVNIIFDDHDIYTTVSEIIMSSRIKKFENFFDTNIFMLWVLEPSSPTMYNKYTVLEEKENGFYARSNDINNNSKINLLIFKLFYLVMKEAKGVDIKYLDKYIKFKKKLLEYINSNSSSGLIEQKLEKDMLMIEYLLFYKLNYSIEQSIMKSNLIYEKSYPFLLLILNKLNSQNYSTEKKIYFLYFISKNSCDLDEIIKKNIHGFITIIEDNYIEFKDYLLKGLTAKKNDKKMENIKKQLLLVLDKIKNSSHDRKFFDMIYEIMTIGMFLNSNFDKPKEINNLQMINKKIDFIKKSEPKDI